MIIVPDIYGLRLAQSCWDFGYNAAHQDLVCRMLIILSKRKKGETLTLSDCLYSNKGNINSYTRLRYIQTRVPGISEE